MIIHWSRSVFNQALEANDLNTHIWSWKTAFCFANIGDQILCIQLGKTSSLAGFERYAELNWVWFGRGLKISELG
jgi:hypothetical protein